MPPNRKGAKIVRTHNTIQGETYPDRILVELQPKKKYTGVYCFAPTLDPKKGLRSHIDAAKIGWGLSMVGRLNQYKTCFPFPWWELAFLIINNEYVRVEDRKPLARKLERELHEDLHEHRYIPTDGTYVRGLPEWFLDLTIKEIRDAFKRVADRHGRQVTCIFPTDLPTSKKKSRRTTLTRLHPR